MSEQQMPARIWCDEIDVSLCNKALSTFGRTTYVRADIAERMADALAGLVKAINYRDACSVSGVSAPRLADASMRLQLEIEETQAALSAFKDSAQDRGAS